MATIALAAMLPVAVLLGGISAAGSLLQRRLGLPDASVQVLMGIAFVLAMLNKLLKLKLLSRMAERVTFVLIPPLALIFLVLGTIFLGIATPTEGGAMGAVGAVLMAIVLVVRPEGLFPAAKR